MRSSLLKLLNDNSIQNHLFFFTFTNLVNHVFRQAKTNQSKYQQVGVLRIKSVIMFESEQFIIISMTVKQLTMNYYNF